MRYLLAEEMEVVPPKDVHGSSAQLVLVTGFGPFRKYLTNPSWTAVQELRELGLREGVRLEIAELPVVYQRARQLVSGMWATLQPQLAVHVGVATGARTIILEQCAKNHGYKDCDITGRTPEGHCCVAGGPEKIESLLNMRTISKKLATMDMDIIYSRDAGRYLCDFVYYLSLFHGDGRACFIHVPEAMAGCGLRTLGKTLQMIILEMLQQLPADSSLAECCPRAHVGQ